MRISKPMSTTITGSRPANPDKGARSSNQANNDGRIGESQIGKGKGKEKPLTVTTQPMLIDITTPNYLHNQEIPPISLT